MNYISGMQALNLPCELDTCGDWHRSGMDWDRPFLLESNDSVFGDYGIEHDKSIPGNSGLFSVANHIRACLDLIERSHFALAQGMNQDFFCNDQYDEEVFSKVLLLKTKNNWPLVDDFMTQEYRLRWLSFKEDLYGSNESTTAQRSYPSIFERLAQR